MILENFEQKSDICYDSFVKKIALDVLLRVHPVEAKAYYEDTTGILVRDTCGSSGGGEECRVCC